MDRDRPAPWPTESVETVTDERVFRLERVRRRSPRTGRSHEFLVLRAPDWVNVVAVTLDRRAVLVEQFRHGTARTTLEIPGGAIDPGETPEEAAARELEEETGYRAGELVTIGVVEPNPAILDNRCWTVLALGCRPAGPQRPDPAEAITVRLVPFDELDALIGRGEITHALVVAAHDHLRRGLEGGAPWSRRIPAPPGDGGPEDGPPRTG